MVPLFLFHSQSMWITIPAQYEPFTYIKLDSETYCSKKDEKRKNSKKILCNSEGSKNISS